MSERKPDVFDELDALKGKTVKSAGVLYPISLGMCSLHIEFTDGTLLRVKAALYAQMQTPCLQLEFKTAPIEGTPA